MRRGTGTSSRHHASRSFQLVARYQLDGADDPRVHALDSASQDEVIR